MSLMRQRSPSLPLPPNRQILAQISEQAALNSLGEHFSTPKKKSHELNKTLDVEFMYHLFVDVIEIEGRLTFLKEKFR